MRRWFAMLVLLAAVAVVVVAGVEAVTGHFPDGFEQFPAIAWVLPGQRVPSGFVESRQRFLGI